MYLLDYQKHRGFTLLELILIMLILGMAAAVILPNLNAGNTVKLEAQARELVAVLNHARRSAIVEGQTKTVSLKGGQTDSMQQALQSSDWESRGATVDWDDGMVEDLGENPQIQVSFYPEGGSSGGRIILKQDETKIAVMIDALTGKVERQFTGDF